MKTILCTLFFSLLLTACTDSGTRTDSTPITVSDSDQTSENLEKKFRQDFDQGLKDREERLIKEQAQTLSKIYGSWKLRTNEISWKDQDPQTYRLAQAYILGQESANNSETRSPSVLTWLLEKFRNIKDGSGDGTEMKTLAAEYYKMKK